MCLNFRDRSNIPYNNKKIRWKVVVSDTNKRGQERLIGPYTYKKYAKRGVWMKAVADKGYEPTRHNTGFHVYVSRKAARQTREEKTCTGSKYEVVKVEVEGFVASGHFYKHESETWKRMRILQQK